MLTRTCYSCGNIAIGLAAQRIPLHSDIRKMSDIARQLPSLSSSATSMVPSALATSLILVASSSLKPLALIECRRAMILFIAVPMTSGACLVFSEMVAMYAPSHSNVKPNSTADADAFCMSELMRLVEDEIDRRGVQ